MTPHIYCTFGFNIKNEEIYEKEPTFEGVEIDYCAKRLLNCVTKGKFAGGFKGNSINFDTHVKTPYF